MEFWQTMACCFQMTLIRHGETEENRQRIIQGQQDTKLSDVGLRQAKLLSARLATESFTEIYCSNLVRCRATADAIIKDNHPDITIDPRLRERCFGVFEGMSYSEFMSAAKQAGVAAAQYAPQGGETLDEVVERAKLFFQDLCSHCSSGCGSPTSATGADTILSQYMAGKADAIPIPPVHYLVVTHGGFILALMLYLQSQFVCDIPKWHTTPNTAVTSLLVNISKPNHVDETGKRLSVTCLCSHSTTHLEN